MFAARFGADAANQADQIVAALVDAGNWQQALVWTKVMSAIHRLARIAAD
jgi:hypothetical protein